MGPSVRTPFFFFSFLDFQAVFACAYAVSFRTWTVYVVCSLLVVANIRPVYKKTSRKLLANTDLRLLHLKVKTITDIAHLLSSMLGFCKAHAGLHCLV